MNPDKISSLTETYHNGLFNDVVPFWLQHGIDPQHGGLWSSLDRDGSLLDSDKSVWAQGRCAWMLAFLYNQTEGNDDYLAAAENIADFLLKHGSDPTDGRMWFHLTTDGQPIRKRRYAFSESFAAIAFGELYKATGKESYRHQAEAAFNAFVTHDQRTDLGPAKFTEVRPSIGLGVPMITIVTAQELRQSIGLESADTWIDRSIQVIESRHLNHEYQCVMETVTPDGKLIDHFDGRTLNPGHAIEGAWFIMREGQYRKDYKLIQLGCQMLDYSWQRGWDTTHGGILYFVDVKGLPVQEYWHDMKFWWPQNETVIATLLAYQLTSDKKYESWFDQIHQWSWDHFPDQDYGEWFGYLRRDGSPTSHMKGNMWKSLFHLPRMMWVCYDMLRSM